MQFKFSDIQVDAYGHIERPAMILYQADDTPIGYLKYAFGVSVELKYNELSTAQFSYPREVDGVPQEAYQRLTIGRIVEIVPYGKFIISDIDENEEDGRWIASISMNSLEYELTNKQIVFAAGTYKLYSPTDNSDSIAKFVLEKTLNWKIGTVDASLWTKYRTFTQTEQDILDFLYNVVQETYGCVVVFDTKNRTINFVDATADTKMIPVYLSSDNVIKEQKLTTNDSDVANKVSVYGADNVDIRDVNPTGTTEIINLGYALSTGDLSGDLADKYIAWQSAIIAQQDYYTGIVSLRNSTASRLLAEKAKLTDLKGKLTELENTQSTTLQMLNTAKQQETIDYMQQRLKEILAEQADVKQDIAEQEKLIEEIQADYDQYVTDAIAVTDELKLTSWFTEDEQKILDKLFIEGTYSDSTFATFDVDISGEDDSYDDLSNETILLSDVTVIDVKMPEGSTHRILDVAGGQFSMDGTKKITAELMHATMDTWDSQSVCSLFVGSGTIGDEKIQSANISITFDSGLPIDSYLSNMTKHTEVIEDDDTGVQYTKYYYTGTISISSMVGKMYTTRNATEYQKYSVQKELYDYATGIIDKMAYPITEFEIDSANIVYAEKFSYFRELLELGCGVYLKITDSLSLKPVLLEVHLDFDDFTKFEMVFSNQFQSKRHDAVNKLSEILDASSNASKSFDLSRYEFGKYEVSGAESALSNFLQNGMDAAYQQVTAGKDQTVVIDGSGITVKTADSPEYIKLANGMIAIIDPSTEETKAAIGHFYNSSTKTNFNGVLADVIGGTLIAGKNMHMECFSPDGKITQFKFDSTGAFLNNSRLYLQSDVGGRIGLDPEHGFLAGTSSLFTVTDTGIIKPSCKDDNGDLVFDDDGFPKDTNVYIGLDGKAYFRGTVYATDGDFTGNVTAKNFYFDTGEDVLTLISKNQCDLSGLDYIDLGGITLDGKTGNINFTGAGSITWGQNAPTKKQFAASSSGPWHDTMESADKWRRDYDYAADAWGEPYQFKGEDGAPGADGSDANVPKYIHSTYIGPTTIQAPVIEATEFNVYPEDASSDGQGSFNIYGDYENTQFHMLRIEYFAGGAPYINFLSPAGAISSWDFGMTHFRGSVSFYGQVDFTSADEVKGLVARFG